jgi:ubiquinone/menaquinone biosynthesis C-methylase UbiE
MNMEERKKEEMEFHDRLRRNAFGQRWSPQLEKSIKDNPLWANMKYYSVERKSRKFVLEWLRLNCKRKDVLDYCCGNGQDALFAAKNKANSVTGIDISKVSIDNCRIMAEKEGISEKAKFYVMDAENLSFPDNSFDVVTEYGCLHHLEIDKAFSEISRVLKPKGMAICNEALGHNMAIQLYRSMTPGLRTKFETLHILKKKDMKTAKKYFKKVECHFFHLATLSLVPLRNLPGFKSLLKIAETLDLLFLNCPGLRWQAWQIIFVLSEPKKRVKC